MIYDKKNNRHCQFVNTFSIQKHRPKHEFRFRSCLVAISDLWLWVIQWCNCVYANWHDGIFILSMVFPVMRMSSMVWLKSQRITIAIQSAEKRCPLIGPLIPFAHINTPKDRYLSRLEIAFDLSQLALNTELEYPGLQWGMRLQNDFAVVTAKLFSSPFRHRVNTHRCHMLAIGVSIFSKLKFLNNFESCQFSELLGYQRIFCKFISPKISIFQKIDQKKPLHPISAVARRSFDGNSLIRLGIDQVGVKSTAYVILAQM